MQGRHLYILRYLASVFGNSVSILIAMLGLSGHSNRYRAIVAVACNTPGLVRYQISPMMLQVPFHFALPPSQSPVLQTHVQYSPNSYRDAICYDGSASQS